MLRPRITVSRVRPQDGSCFGLLLPIRLSDYSERLYRCVRRLGQWIEINGWPTGDWTHRTYYWSWRPALRKISTIQRLLTAECDECT
jgi:hypothetical protein